MAKIPRQWIYSPRPASLVPEAVKEQVTAKANEIIEAIFKQLAPISVEGRMATPN